MYKKIISVIMLVIMLMMLASCGKNENTPQEDETPGPEPGETISLKVVFNEAGKTFLNYGGGNGHGFYDIVPRIWNLGEQISTGEFDNNIVYTDYETMTRVYLCNDPACKHDSENCTSYIKSSSSAIVFPVEDKLVCLRLGKADGIASKEEDLCAVLVMDLDGSNRKTLCTFASTEFFAQPFIVLSDGKCIIFQLVSLNEKNQTVKNIVSLDLGTGKRNTVVDVSTTYFLVSAYGDCMLFYDVETADNFVYSLSEKTLVKSISGVSGLYKDNISVDLRYDVDVSNYHNIMNAKEITVIISNMQSCEVKKLGSFTLEDDHAAVALTDLFDDHLCISYITNISTTADYTNYNLDLTKGEIIKNTLLIEKNGVYRPTAIIADAGDSYLVYYDTIHAVQTFYDRQGVVHTVDNNAYPQYALINKDDYYSNVPNYEVINDTLCDLG